VSVFNKKVDHCLDESDDVTFTLGEQNQLTTNLTETAIQRK
jgi:hypothetical protein